MNTGVLNKIGAGIEDVAASIAKSDWWSKIAPKDMNTELASYVAGSTKHTSEIAQNTIRKTLESKMQITDEIENAIKKVSATNLEKSIDENIKDVNGGVPEAVLEMLKKRANASIKDIDGNAIVQQMTKAERYMITPQAYFSHPDKKIKNTRIQTAVAAYAGLTVGSRYLSGGTLTTDQYGRGDIAGVPFL